MSEDTKALIATVCEQTTKVQSMHQSVGKLNLWTVRILQDVPTLMAEIIGLQKRVIELQHEKIERMVEPHL